MKRIVGGNGGCGARLDGSGTNVRFGYPYGIAASSSGNVYVAEPAQYIIRKIDTAGS